MTTAGRLTPAQMQAAGIALYGERWQSDLARDLGIRDSARIREWMRGARPIPQGLLADVLKLLRSRSAQTAALADALAADVPNVPGRRAILD